MRIQKSSIVLDNNYKNILLKDFTKNYTGSIIYEVLAILYSLWIMCLIDKIKMKNNFSSDANIIVADREMQNIYLQEEFVGTKSIWYTWNSEFHINNRRNANGMVQKIM